MNCIQFWMVNSFLGSIAFLILFIIIDGQYPLYPYAVAGSRNQPNNQKSGTACILASAFYVFIGLGLLLWQKSRENRIEKTQQYLRSSTTTRSQRQQNDSNSETRQVNSTIPQLEL